MFSTSAELVTEVTALTTNINTDSSRTKLMVLVAELDIPDPGVRAAVTAWRQAGGLTAVVSADPNVGLANYIQLASSPAFIFEEENFSYHRVAQFIAHKLCIGECFKL